MSREPLLITILLLNVVIGNQTAEAQMGKPVVHVLVSIEDPDLLLTYNEDMDALHNVEFSVAKTLAARFSDTADYVQWTPVRPEPWSPPPGLTDNLERPRSPLGEAVARVTLTMRQRLDMSVLVKFEIDNGATTDTLKDIEPWYVYRPADLRHATDVKGIKQALEKTIEANFDSRFDARFRDAVKLYIPIARGLTAIKGDGHLRFVIPIQWSDLNPGEASVFYTQMMVPAKSGLMWVAKLYLAPPQRYQARNSFVIATPVHECKRHKFAFDPIKAKGSTADCWTAPSSDYPALQNYLTAEVLKTARVYLVDYFRDAISQ